MFQIKPENRPSAQELLKHAWFSDDIFDPTNIPRLSVGRDSGNTADSTCSSRDGRSPNPTVSELLGNETPASLQSLGCNKRASKLNTAITSHYLERLSISEYSEILNAFKEMDTDHDNCVTINDIMNVLMDSTKGINANEASAMARMVVFELDRSGENKLRFEDYAMARLSHRLQTDARTLKALFLKLSTKSPEHSSRNSMDGSFVSAAGLLALSFVFVCCFAFPMRVICFVFFLFFFCVLLCAILSKLAHLFREILLYFLCVCVCVLLFSFQNKSE